MKKYLNNDFPKIGILSNGDITKISEHLVLNTFILACEVAKKKGYHIEYDGKKNEARITNFEGKSSTIKH